MKATEEGFRVLPQQLHHLQNPPLTVVISSLESTPRKGKLTRQAGEREER